MLKAAFAAIIFAAAAPVAAAAEVKSALTGEEIASVLSEAGLEAAAMEDAASKSPVFKIMSEDGGEFWVRTLDCKGTPTACSTLVLFRNFSLREGVASAMHYEIVNAYNERKLSGRAYVLKGTGPGGDDQVGVDYVVELDGGVSTEHVARRIKLWSEIVRAFIQEFQAGRAARS
ncbi:MAG: YbjN domain-containing protein [Parvularculaceae bacterium]|nr:YbjN domain-containing protein [Parvularculaceae bacterium]